MKHRSLVISLAIVIILALTIVDVMLVRYGDFLSMDKQIARKIPAGAVIREVVRLEGVKPNAYLFIYLEKGYQLSDFAEGDVMLSCPEMILGQSITGNYHLGLWQNGKIVNEIPISSPYGEMGNKELSLVYRNTKENIYTAYGGEDKYTVEKVSLLKLSNYTGRGKNWDVLFKTTAGGCGFWDGLVAGYDPGTNRVVAFSTWLPRFEPDRTGEFHYLFECGDHGNDTRIETDFAFNSTQKKFTIVSDKSTKCSW
jgi:hypothetical protein